MSEIQMIKHPTGKFIAANDIDRETLDKIKNGQLCLVKITQPRNPKFHRKFFALLNFGYQYWEPTAEAINGVQPVKNFERFRKDILILAGFRHAVVNVRNEVRYEAESISFAKMDETRFSEVYQRVFDVLWQLVLRKVHGMTPELAENTINEMLAYD